MLLYDSTCERFCDDVKSDRIAEIVNGVFRREFGKLAMVQTV